jgi:PHB/PHA accumulation regulator DNA-binding domain
MPRKRRDPVRGLPLRVLRRESDGRLYDVTQGRPVMASELRQDVRDGRRFRAEDARSGDDCTYEVLAELVWGSIGGSQTGSSPGGLGGLGRVVTGGLANVSVRGLLDRFDRDEFWEGGRRERSDSREGSRRRRGGGSRHDPPDPDADR